MKKPCTFLASCDRIAISNGDWPYLLYGYTMSINVIKTSARTVGPCDKSWQTASTNVRVTFDFNEDVSPSIVVNFLARVGDAKKLKSGAYVTTLKGITAERDPTAFAISELDRLYSWAASWAASGTV